MFDSLKNFFGGKKQPDGSEAQQPESQPENALKKAPLRFTLMAERVLPDAGEGFYAEGELFGEAAVGERVTVLHRDGNISHPVLEEIEGSGANTKLIFSGKEGLSLDWTYALITNIPYQIEVDVNRPIENPYLLGLTRVVFRFQQEGEFLNLFHPGSRRGSPAGLYGLGRHTTNGSAGRKRLEAGDHGSSFSAARRDAAGKRGLCDQSLRTAIILRLARHHPQHSKLPRLSE